MANIKHLSPELQVVKHAANALTQAKLGALEDCEFLEMTYESGAKAITIQTRKADLNKAKIILKSVFKIYEQALDDFELKMKDKYEPEPTD